MDNYEDLIGIPFIDGGRNKEGFDCWGLVKEIYKRNNIDLPDYAISATDAVAIANQMEDQKFNWIEIEIPTSNCLVVIKLASDGWANHVGVYIGNGYFIHAYSKKGVCVDRVRNWRSNIIGYYVPIGMH